MAPTMLDYALKYRRMGFSIIPCKKDKRPLLKWEPYQLQKPTEAEIKEWWGKWPDANIAIVCGQVSGVDVLDCDSQEAYDNVNDFYLSDSFQTPTVKTPKGRHLYFKHRSGLTNQVQAIKGTDIRTYGGYVVAPPSKNGNGNAYYWFDGLKPNEVEFSEWPDELFATLQAVSNTNNKYSVNTNTRGFPKTDDVNNDVNAKSTKSTLETFLCKGQRNDDLFRVANCLTKGGAGEQLTEKVIEILASNCTPAFENHEIKTIIDSAVKRGEKREGSLTAEIREFIESTLGNFRSTDIIKTSTMSTFDDRRKVSAILSRMVKEGFIERVPPNNGVFRRVDSSCTEMDYLNCTIITKDLWLPLGIHEMVEIMPGNQILIAGAPNAGKTAFVLNIIRNNMEKYKIHYFNSEMGDSELGKRLRKFEDLHIRDWKFSPKNFPESGNVQDAIVPGENVINIIDYIEMHDNFYQISGVFKEIHNKLKGAIAIICLQKNPGAPTGLGGYRTLEKPRLAINLDPGICKIVKAKNWRTEKNPNGRQRQFKLIQGWDIVGVGGWNYNGE